MLFDLRSRGRRRTVQAIYLTLAILMGGGLVLFGIGGDVQGGLVDAIRGDSGGQSADDAFQDRVNSAEARVQTNPDDAAAWARLAGLRFQVASTGENYDQTTGQFTDKGKEALRSAQTAWNRHLQLEPRKPDATVANQMVQAFGVTGLQAYDDAVRAMEIVIEDREPTSALYAQLAVLAHAAKQERKSTLAERKAVELAPRARRKDIRAQIQLAKTQLDNQAAAGQPQS
jgi:hypothetical protein